MIKCFEKKYAFSLTEAIITMLILGIVMSLAIAGIKLFAPTEEGQTTLSWKMAENIESATLQILLNHSSYDDFLRIKDGNGYFSIEDADITKRMSDLYSKYLSDISYNVDLTNEYFSEEIRDYNKTSTGEKLKDAYSSGCAGRLVIIERTPVVAAEEKSEIMSTCSRIEQLLKERLIPEDDTRYEAHLRNADTYSTLAERGCEENADMYKTLALREIEIATALQPEEYMTENDTVIVIDTFKKLNMQREAKEFLNKIEKLIELVAIIVVKTMLVLMYGYWIWLIDLKRYS